MKQKMNWMNYLTIGISLIFLQLFQGCNRQDKYIVKVKWTYINETDSTISYYPIREKFNLEPKDTVIYEEVSEGNKDTEVGQLVSPLRPYIIYFGSNLCDTLSSGNNASEGEGPLGIENYEAIRLGKNTFELTYRFGSKDILKADTCM